MEIRVERLFGALVVTGIALAAGCRETEEARVDSGPEVHAVADAGTDGGPVVIESDAGPAPSDDAGVDSWLSWT